MKISDLFAQDSRMRFVVYKGGEVVTRFETIQECLDYCRDWVKGPASIFDSERHQVIIDIQF